MKLRALMRQEFETFVEQCKLNLNLESPHQEKYQPPYDKFAGDDGYEEQNNLRAKGFPDLIKRHSACSAEGVNDVGGNVGTGKGITKHT
jgi:hypothetical protein